jgi:hypothetical protein
VLANDADADGDELIISALVAPQHGRLDNYSDPKGRYTYVPDQGFTGTDSFSYTINDLRGGRTLRRSGSRSSFR